MFFRKACFKQNLTDGIFLRNLFLYAFMYSPKTRFKKINLARGQFPERSAGPKTLTPPIFFNFFDLRAGLC